MHRFTPDDLPELNKMYAKRHNHMREVYKEKGFTAVFSDIELEDLPLNGWIEAGVGAMFLVSTDTRTAYVEYMVTDPDASARQRSDFIDATFYAMDARAKELGFKTLVGWPNEQQTVDRAIKRYGWEAGTVAQTVIYRVK